MRADFFRVDPIERILYRKPLKLELNREKNYTISVIQSNQFKEPIWDNNKDARCDSEKNKGDEVYS